MAVLRQAAQHKQDGRRPVQRRAVGLTHMHLRTGGQRHLQFHIKIAGMALVAVLLLSSTCVVSAA